MNKNLLKKLKNHVVRKAKGPQGLGQRADSPHGPMNVTSVMAIENDTTKGIEKQEDPAPDAFPGFQKT